MGLHLDRIWIELVLIDLISCVVVVLRVLGHLDPNCHAMRVSCDVRVHLSRRRFDPSDYASWIVIWISNCNHLSIWITIDCHLSWKIDSGLICIDCGLVVVSIASIPHHPSHLSISCATIQPWLSLLVEVEGACKAIVTRNWMDFKFILI